MTLDNAIEHAEQMAELAKWGPLEDEYQQQLDWLKELKKHRSVQDVALANARAANLESEQLKSENASLRGAAMGLGELCDQLEEENKRLKRKLEILKAHGVEIVDAVAGGFEVYSEDNRRADAIEGENARYRELVEILRRDWHIEASWDGLRKFWYVGLTEEGVRERDERDAKAMEAANIEIGELRALCKSMRCALVGYHDQVYLTALDKILVENGFEMREMGVEVE